MFETGEKSWREAGHFRVGGGDKKEQGCKNCNVSEHRDALRGTISRGRLGYRKKSRARVRGVKLLVRSRESEPHIFEDAAPPGWGTF
jgi:hypothetical protein